MPKRKAAAKPDDVTEDANATHPNGQDEPPAKKPRGRPKSSQKEPDPKTTETKDVKKPGKRGRPKGSRTSGEHGEGKDAHGSAVTSNDELAPSTSKPKPRGRKAESALTDGEFKYTPTRSRKSLEKGKDPERDQPDVVPETQPEVGEPILSTPTPRRSLSPTKSGYNRLAIQRALQNSPSKRKPDGEGDPELRRRIGELTRRCDTLENRYNRLRDVGVVQANANMEKLQKQCETITEDSNNLIAALKEELEAQRALGKQTRTLQKQLADRDAEMERLSRQAEEKDTQLSSAQSEVKALQAKLAAARNTASSLESTKGAKNTPANRAQSAETAQVAQIAQLKEDFYSDLTGLIIRDVKKRETDHLYDCIQTGSNGTLHFKLAVPHVSSANYESAEFQYVPFLDENRDRDLVSRLPEYLTVDITFSRQQASKFYTRVIDALTRRRNSEG